MRHPGRTLKLRTLLLLTVVFGAALGLLVRGATSVRLVNSWALRCDAGSVSESHGFDGIGRSTSTPGVLQIGPLRVTF